MVTIRHLALATNDPVASAAFYRNGFGFAEVARSPNAVFLADGNLNLALIRFSTDQLGRGMDYVGLHHFGLLVDDVAAWRARLAARGIQCFMEPPKDGSGDFNYEYKFRGPDGVVFDLTDHPWKGTVLDKDSASSKGDRAMAKIRHIALATNDPVATAEFYKQAFGFEEIERRDNPLATGVFLTDGSLNLAILKFKSDQLGKGMDYVGLHHFGILVEDVRETMDKLEAMGTQCFLKPEPGDNSGFEYKFHGPDGVVFDIAEHPWGGTAALEHEPVPGRPSTPLSAK
jgi:catechol 2,3-dioxygenase-like lactoylglutathione lyase family enzyme